MTRSGWARPAHRATVLVVATVLPLALLTPAGQAAPGRSAGPSALPAERPVPGHDLAPPARRAAAIDEKALRTAPAVAWPSAGAADVAVPAGVITAVRAGSLPVWLGASSSPTGGRAASVSSASGPDRVRVEVLGRAAAARAGIPGVLLRVTRSDGQRATGPVSLRVDYSAFRFAFGGDWASRLTLSQLPSCAVSAPARPGCQPTVLRAANDVNAGRITATVPAGPAATVVALAAAPAGGGGDFTASALSASATWQVSPQSGDFSWSYPLRVPPVPGGLAPKLALTYDSGDVDGRTTSTNNQPSWVGEGWQLWPGYVERKYRSCADDGQAGVGDLCWGPDNATLVLNGRATELVKDGDSWHGRSDDGSAVERLTDASNGASGGEYWRVTTTDGTQYYFGRNQLPGGTASSPATNSTWTVPVFGNNDNEPCHQATFAASSCNQAWRWNLDYVVDPHGNSLSYFYTPETNYYDKNKAASGTAYTRGGYLTKVVYGTRSSANYAQPPAQVVFGTADRCITAPCTLTSNPAPTATPNANWPDLPSDQYCNSATCTNKFSPTFFTQKKLTGITTQVWTGSAYRNVDAWSLAQTYPSPADGTTAALWLSSITRSGQATGTSVAGGNLTMPPVKFDGTFTPNRLNPRSGYASVNKLRLGRIQTETGGQLDIAYKDTDCNPDSPPAQDQNTHRCFPVWWAPPGASLQLDWFQRYVVGQVTAEDLIAGDPAQETDYDYIGPAAWHYADADEIAPVAKRTWSQWRGYAEVHVRGGNASDEGPQSLAVSRFYRGMDGDKLSSGARSAAVTDSQGDAHPDLPGLSGFLLEQQTFNGVGGGEVSGQISDPVRVVTGSHQHDGLTVTAYMVHTAAEHGRLGLDGGRSARRTETDYAYDEHGNTTRIDDHGDLATTGDDRCTRTSYASNDTRHMFAYPAESTAVAISCGATPSYPDDAISDARTYYDGSTALGTLTGAGDPTRVDAVSGYSGSTPRFITTTQATYDEFGRKHTTTDALQHTTTTDYTETGGLTTKTVVTNPATFATTTTIEPSWGVPTVQVDANSMRTDLQYDSLGRLTGVWRPGRNKAQGYTPTVGYGYLLHCAAAGPGCTTGANAVSTSVLGPNSSSPTSYALLDGLLRQRQTQAPATGGIGRVVTETFYNSHGLQAGATGAYWNEAAPPGTTLVATASNVIPGQTGTLYDGANRPAASIFYAKGVEKWRTSSRYGGDHIDVTPPDGGTATSSYTDARGQTTKLLQYHGRTPTGAADATSYRYTPAGQLAQVTDPAGNHWDYGYDLLGRRTSSTDPDTGTSTSTYDNAGQLLTSTDSRGQTLAYTYDNLGRKTGEYAGSTSGVQLAGWAHDTLLKGYPTSSTRYVEGQAYTSAFQGYTKAGLPYGQDITIPAREGALAGTYRYDYIYNVDGSLAVLDLPFTPGLPNESLSYTYDSLGHQADLETGLPTGIFNFVTGAKYTELGQPARFTLNNGGASVFLSWLYDLPTERLTESALEIGGDAHTAGDLHYSYDPAGNVTEIADTPTAGSTDNQCFRYDYLRRLTQAWTPASGDCTPDPSVAGLGGAAPYWQTYDYDLTGDRTSLISHAAAGDTTHISRYPGAGQPQPHILADVSTTGPGGLHVDSYGYDAAGNTIVRAPSGKPAQTFDYDTEGNLASITEGISTVASYVYDPDGNQLVRHDSTGATLYLPHGVQVHVDAAGVATSTRYYTFGGTTFAVRTSAGVSFLASDAHGTSTQAVSSTTGALTTRRTDPFGNPRTPAALPGDRGFVGGISESATGLTDLGAREYDPTLGRFTTPDPVLDPSDPQQLNGFSYADGNPTTNSDPTGQLCTNGFDGGCHTPNGDNIPTPGVSEQGGSDPSATFDHGNGITTTVTARHTYLAGIELPDSAPPSAELADRISRRIPKYNRDYGPGLYIGGSKEFTYKDVLAIIFKICGQDHGFCGDEFGHWAMQANLAAGDSKIRGYVEMGGAEAAALGGAIVGKGVLRVAEKAAAEDGLTALERGAARVPKDWGPGMANKKGVGTRWTDPTNPGNGIRVDEGIPGSNWPSQQVDHVVVRSGGRILGPEGKPIVGSLAQNPQAHIPLSDWLNWSSWSTP